MDDAFRAALRKIEDEILWVTGNARERVVALDAQGRAVFAKTGTGHEITFTPGELAIMMETTAVVTHNHDDSSAFSLEDLTLAIYLNVAELHVFGFSVRWRLIRSRSVWPRFREIRAAFVRADRRVARELYLLKRQGGFAGNPFSWIDRSGHVWARLQREHPDWFIVVREEREP